MPSLVLRLIIYPATSPPAESPRCLCSPPRILIAGLALTADPPASGKYWVYVGTYTSKDGSKGIYRCELDLKTGKLSEPAVAAEVGSPSFLTLSPDGKYLYAVGETTGEQEGRRRGVRLHRRCRVRRANASWTPRRAAARDRATSSPTRPASGCWSPTTAAGAGSCSSSPRTASSAGVPCSASWPAAGRTRSGRRSRTPTAARSTPRASTSSWSISAPTRCGLTEHEYTETGATRSPSRGRSRRSSCRPAAARGTSTSPRPTTWPSSAAKWTAP